MAFETQIAQLESTDLDKLFDATPEGTPNANDLKVSKKGEEDNKMVITPIGGSDIPQFTDDLLEIVETHEEKIEREKTEKEIADKLKAEENLTEEQKTAKLKEETDLKQKEEDALKANSPEVKTVLKNTIDYLIDNGFWADFDGRKDLEVTQEVYADLAAKQNQHNALEIVNELIDGTGSYGKAIISHIKNGGNPDEIIDLFKEQKALEQIDSSTEQGKQLKIEKYYKEILGWKDEKVTKTVKRLIADNEVDSEFKDVEELYDKYYKEKLLETQAEATAQQQKNTERQQTFVKNINTALSEDTTLTTQDKKIIASSILDFKHKLDDGKKVNDFYLKFAEMQADPKQYIKLVRFVMDNENYEKAIQSKIETKVAKDTFNFIKGNAAIDKAKSTNLELNTEKSSSKKGTDFSFAIRK